jgi:hypothetical protein
VPSAGFQPYERTPIDLEFWLEGNRNPLKLSFQRAANAVRMAELFGRLVAQHLAPLFLAEALSLNATLAVDKSNGADSRGGVTTLDVEGS